VCVAAVLVCCVLYDDMQQCYKDAHNLAIESLRTELSVADVTLFYCILIYIYDVLHCMLPILYQECARCRSLE
jgi:hypothetical protein